MKPAPDSRKVYMIAGHGEMTSYDSVPLHLKARVRERRTSELERVLGKLGYERKQLGPTELSRDVPADAAIVFLLAPSVPLQPAEWDALGRYLDRGGRLLIALDPTGEPGLGSLEGKLGLRFNPAHLMDDREFLLQRATRSDRQFVTTTQFSSHPVTIRLLQTGKGLVMIDSGALEDVPFTARGPTPTRTVVIRSGPRSWLDLDKDFDFDEKTEQRQHWNLAVAIEGPKDAAKGGSRILVFADADLFTEVYVPDATGNSRAVLVSGPLLGHSLHWLSGE